MGWDALTSQPASEHWPCENTMSERYSEFTNPVGVRRDGVPQRGSIEERQLLALRERAAKKSIGMRGPRYTR